jgi:hypothetical protein
MERELASWDRLSGGINLVINNVISEV